MPEGDTILRTARSLGRWLEARVVTAASSQRAGVDAAKLVGQRVTAVEARAKHLLIRFSSGDVLHTHMRMTGSWHLYPAGQRWRKPGWQARVVLEAGDRVAVCFDAPVVELLRAGDEDRHPSLARLGPDVLVHPLDLAEVRRRAALRPPELSVGELLLDQQVVSGIGNIYRSEALFVRRLNPWTPQQSIGDDGLDELVSTASRLMGANLKPAQGFTRQFGPGAAGPRVYDRAGRPCRRCRAAIRTDLLGEQARRVWWCPGCQVTPMQQEGAGPAPPV
ncbi:MAG TPA: DNA-formamidopyrimidine glycosylase family protein [Acidimicrobiales bacterium]|nr:DNA-formamidopyrimidine glycosylase family protein [Acidimicrobiales bacterium]